MPLTIASPRWKDRLLSELDSVPRLCVPEDAIIQPKGHWEDCILRAMTRTSCAYYVSGRGHVNVRDVGYDDEGVCYAEIVCPFCAGHRHRIKQSATKIVSVS